MKAYSLSGKTTPRNIILLRIFHLTSAFMKIIGKRMRGTGLSDILLEAGLNGSGAGGSLEWHIFQEYISSHDEALTQQSQRILDDVICYQSFEATNPAIYDDALPVAVP